MKGLLHSKRFRKNLKKWLFMYVGTLLLFTTVVTYSKYISSFGVSDEARVTKFNVVASPLNNTNCSGEDENKTCITDNYRPTSEIPYDFTVKSELEVKTILALTINVDTNFNILKIEEVVGDTTTPIYKKDEEVSNSNYTVSTESVEAGVITITRNIEASSTEEKIYRVTVKYKYDEKTYSSDKVKNINVVRIDYSATQSK